MWLFPRTKSRIRQGPSIPNILTLLDIRFQMFDLFWHYFTSQLCWWWLLPNWILASTSVFTFCLLWGILKWEYIHNSIPTNGVLFWRHNYPCTPTRKGRYTIQITTKCLHMSTIYMCTICIYLSLHGYAS